MRLEHAEPGHVAVEQVSLDLLVRKGLGLVFEQPALRCRSLPKIDLPWT